MNAPDPSPNPDFPQPASSASWPKEPAACQATPREELRQQIMSHNVPKNEREHWAQRRIERLESELRDIAAELTEVAQENMVEMGETTPRISWRLKSVRDVLASP